MRHFLGELLDADEPFAMLASFHRIAERKAHAAAKAQNFDVAMPWHELAEVLAIAKASLAEALAKAAVRDR